MELVRAHGRNASARAVVTVLAAMVERVRVAVRDVVAHVTTQLRGKRPCASGSGGTIAIAGAATSAATMSTR